MFTNIKHKTIPTFKSEKNMIKQYMIKKTYSIIQIE